MSTKEAFQLRHFKGLNLEPRAGLGSEELTVCNNFNFGLQGELKLRQGLQVVSTGFADTDRVLGLYSTPTLNKIIYKVGTTLYQGGVGAASLISGANNCSDVEWMVQYLDKVYFIRSGNASLYVWDGTTFSVSAAANTPKGTFGLIHKDRLFIFDAVNLNRVWYSAIADPLTWTVSGLFDVQSGDGSQLTAGIVLHDQLFLFKTRGCWSLIVQGNPSDWTLRLVNSVVGCTSRSGVLLINTEIFILSHDGVYKSNGYFFDSVSRMLPEVFANRHLLNHIHKEVIARLDDKLVCYVFTTIDGYRTYVYNYILNAWTRWTFPANEMSNYVAVDRSTLSLSPGLYTPRGYMSGDDTTLNTYADYGTFFNGSLSTAILEMAEYGMWKRCKWMDLELVSTLQVVVTYLVNETSTVNGNTFSTTGGIIKSLKSIGPGRFRTLVVNLSVVGTNVAQGTQTVIFGMGLHVEKHSRLGAVQV